MKPTEIKNCKRHGSTEHYIDSENHLRCRLCERERGKRADTKHREKRYAKQKENRDKWRKLTLQHYSENEIPFCSCCKETIYEFLALDHVEGKGNEHRKEVGLGGARMYKWAIDNDYPPIFRVLCHNCNQSYGLYGYCPHNKNH